MRSLPSGTVTFLFTDIEDSTKLAQSFSDRWEFMRARHNRILASAIESNNGYVFEIIGDAFCSAFDTAGDAVRAAVQSQIDLHDENWSETPLRVRMGIHTGKAELQEGGNYHGYLALSRIQRLMAAGHGGQVLVSLVTEELIREELPENVVLRDIGERRFKDLIRPERIYQLVIDNLPADFPPLKTLDAYQHNLPVQLTNFIGREHEITNIMQAIMEHRLVTLTGVGGTGKTRLALQVAVNLLDEFVDGVWFVELAPLTDPTLIPQTVVSTLQLHELPGRSAIETVSDFLGTRKVLLLLDNCEHLIHECAEFADRLLQNCTKLRILITSREALSITGEMIFSIASLSIPETDDPDHPVVIAEFESVQLFVDRACMVNPSFKLTPTNASSVAQICTRLDGIPLAVELAAARVRGMGVEKIASRLDHRFRLLTGGSRTAMQRQQTLSATVDWSFDLLTNREKTLFQMLSVFNGLFTLQAVEKVCRIDDVDELEIADLIQRLVDKSIVTTEEGYGETYYHLLETIRLYGRNKLLASNKAEQLADRHASYFMEWAKQASAQLRGPDQIPWTHRCIMMRANLRSALGWLIETGKTESALQFVCDLYEFWLRHADFEEARQWLRTIMTLPDSRQFAERYTSAHISLSWTLWLQGRIDESKTMAEQALEMAQSQTSTSNLAKALVNLGVHMMHEKDFSKAQSYMEESRDLSRQTHDEWALARAWMDLGLVHMYQQQYTLARSHYQEALSIYIRLRDLNFQSVVLRLTGMLEIGNDNLDEGIRAHRESLRIASAVKNNLQIAYNIWGLAKAALSSKSYTRAIQLYMSCKRICERIGVWVIEDERELEEDLNPARAALDELTFNTAVEQGYTMRMEEAIEYALKDADELPTI